MNELYEIKLIERNGISRVWKAFHILILICVAICGSCGGIILAFLYDEEDYLCGTPIISPTYKIDHGKHQATINKTIFKLDFVASKGSKDVCEFTEYTLITSFIFAWIWVVFFMMCGRGGKSEDGLPKPWRIVLPALVFSVIMTVTTFGASIQFTTDKNIFCETFDKAMTNITKEKYEVKCEKLNLFVKVNQMPYLKVQDVIKLAEIMAWLCMTSWALSAALCITRFIRGPDFQQVLVPLEGSTLVESDRYRALVIPPARNSSILSEVLSPSSDLSQSRKSSKNSQGETPKIMQIKI